MLVLRLREVKPDSGVRSQPPPGTDPPILRSKIGGSPSRLVQAGKRQPRLLGYSWCPLSGSSGLAGGQGSWVPPDWEQDVGLRPEGVLPLPEQRLERWAWRAPTSPARSPQGASPGWGPAHHALGLPDSPTLFSDHPCPDCGDWPAVRRGCLEISGGPGPVSQCQGQRVTRGESALLLPKAGPSSSPASSGARPGSPAHRAQGLSGWGGQRGLRGLPGTPLDPATLEWPRPGAVASVTSSCWPLPVELNSLPFLGPCPDIWFPESEPDPV